MHLQTNVVPRKIGNFFEWKEPVHKKDWFLQPMSFFAPQKDKDLENDPSTCTKKVKSNDATSSLYHFLR